MGGGGEGEGGGGEGEGGGGGGGGGVGRANRKLTKTGGETHRYLGVIKLQSSLLKATFRG